MRDWLKSLSKEDCKTIGTDILSVQYAWPVGKPLVDNLGDGIWEVRSRLDNRIARTLFAVIDQEIVLLHGFIKKQPKAPQDELVELVRCSRAATGKTMPRVEEQRLIWIVMYCWVPIVPMAEFRTGGNKQGWKGW